MGTSTSRPRWLVIAFLLLPAAVRAEPSTPPRDKSYLIPALEITGLHVLTNLVCRLGCGMASHYRVDLESARRNLEEGWTFDSDDFATNNLAHPYQGATAFLAARSNGLSFWESTPYVVGSSALWELFGERTAPSLNDAIVTSMSGILIGEALHRTAALFRGGDDWPVGRGIGAFAADPLGSVNRWVLGPTVEDAPSRAPFFAKVAAGAVFAERARTEIAGEQAVRNRDAQGHLSLHLDYAMLAGDAPLRPLDVFSIDLDATLSLDPSYALFVHGLLAGKRWQHGPSLDGAWGLAGTFDFLDPTVVQTSTVGLGLGSVTRHRLATDLAIRSTLIAAGIPLGAIGALGNEEQGYVTALGPGVQSLLDLRLVSPHGWLGGSARGYAVWSEYRGDGVSTVVYATASANVRVWGPHALGAEIAATWRTVDGSRETRDLDQAGRMVRVYWTMFGEAE